MTDVVVSPSFLRFLVASGVAALVNILSRMAFSTVLPYEVAIVVAFFLGLTTAFVLNRTMVFRADGRLADQFGRFALVNAVALVQVWLVSVLLARWGLPALGVTWHAETIAHVVGVVSPVVTSYFAHRHYTFKPR